MCVKIRHTDVQKRVNTKIKSEKAVHKSLHVKTPLNWLLWDYFGSTYVFELLRYTQIVFLVES